MIESEKTLLFLFVFFFAAVGARAQQAKIYVEKETIETYTFGDPDPVPKIGQGKEIYPYFEFDGYSLTSKPMEWTVITLENSYIKVLVLPGVGGKVWGAIEKSTGRDFIYHNNVLKFRNIALRGPWTSGGIEFNFIDIVGHTYNAASKVDYLIQKNKDGSVSLWIGGLVLPIRTRFRLEIRLPANAAMFKTNGFYYNSSPLYQPYYYWSTAAIHVGDSLQYQFPATYFSHNGFYPWPITEDGRNISFYRNMKPGGGSYFMYGKYANYFGAYWHNLDFGFGHWARYDEMPGRKLFTWGAAEAGAIWETLLTDKSGQYTELQAGRLYSQHDLKLFGPQRTDQWTEIWFPIKKIGGIKAASPYAVMNVEQNPEGLMVGINALQAINDTLKIFKNNSLIYKELISLEPMGVFKTSIETTSNEANYIIKLGDQLSFSTKPHGKNIIRRPKPSLHIHASTAAALYRKGLKYAARTKYDKAIQAYQKSLIMNGKNVSALTKLAQAYTHKAMYQKALKYVNRALAINTYHSDANFIYGVINRRMGFLNQAKVAFGFAARSLKYRTAGYEQIAAINIQQHNWSDAVYYANKALNYNEYNLKAYKDLIIAYWKQNKDQKAIKKINKLLQIDPLSHFAYFERYLVNPTEKRLKSFTSLIRNDLPHQTYLELAMDYYKMGLNRRAKKVLKISPSYPIVNYWLAFLNKNDTQKNHEYLHKALAASPKLVFPFRHETITVLQWASKQENNWKTKYYLALILWSKGRSDEALKLMNAVGNNPGYAPFYLTRAKLRGDDNALENLADLKYALKLDKGQWRTYMTLGNWYMSNDRMEKALNILDIGHKRFENNFYLDVKYASALLKSGNYKKSFELLNKTHLLPSEGARRAYYIFEQALIRLAMQNIEQEKFESALQHLKLSQTYPLHLGVGRPPHPDERVQHYLAAHIYRLQNKTALADSLYRKILTYSKKHVNNYSFNFSDLVTLLVYERYGKKQMAENIRKLFIKNLDDQKLIIAWLQAQQNNQEDKLNDVREMLLKNADSKIPSWFKGFLQLTKE